MLPDKLSEVLVDKLIVEPGEFWKTISQSVISTALEVVGIAGNEVQKWTS